MVEKDGQSQNNKNAMVHDNLRVPRTYECRSLGQ